MYTLNVSNRIFNVYIYTRTYFEAKYRLIELHSPDGHTISIGSIRIHNIISLLRIPYVFCIPE